MQPSDAELVERVASGEQYGLRALVERYHAPLVRYATTLCGDAAAAEDAVQEAFFALWRRADEPRGGDVRPWLYAVTRNATRRLFRRERPELAEPETLDALGKQAGWGDPPGSGAWRGPSRTVTRCALPSRGSVRRTARSSRWSTSRA